MTQTHNAGLQPEVDPYQLDQLVDTLLGQKAIGAVEDYVRRCRDDVEGWPKRSQIKGLVQIAANEPNRVAEFAQKQRERAAKRAMNNQEHNPEVQFWQLIEDICQGKSEWSFEQLREQQLPVELREEKLPPGPKPLPEPRAAREEKRRRREAWIDQWYRMYYPAFFQRFAHHYLYRMAELRASHKQRDDND